MAETADGITAVVARLRRRQAETLSQLTQADSVAALTAIADCWRDRNYPLRLEAEAWHEPFPFAMVRVSLDALLDSLSPEALWALIESEEVQETQGYPVIGHVVAGNTPLLAWVSIIRALLVRSAAFVKLPSGPAAAWGKLFHRALAEVSPEMAECVYVAHWPGGTRELDAALCREADLVMAQGSDATMSSLRALCPAEKPFVGYGHRVSFGLVTRGSATAKVAVGFAQDVLLYDQGGCLSPQTVFVEGKWEDTLAFAEKLAVALPIAAAQFPLPVRSAQAAAAVREARLLAWMEEGNRLWEDAALRWTVIARPHFGFAASPTFGVVSVQPLPSLVHLPEAIAPVAGLLQGCAVAGEAKSYLPCVFYLCAPGELQAPPLAWRQDGRDVLRVLLPPYPYRAGGSTMTCVGGGSVSGESSIVEAE